VPGGGKLWLLRSRRRGTYEGRYCGGYYNCNIPDDDFSPCSGQIVWWLLQLQHPGWRLFSVYVSAASFALACYQPTLSNSCWFKYTVQFQA
jgi:hypothetical protein